MTLTTARLSLRPLSLCDLDALGPLFSDSEVMVFSEGQLDEAGVRAWIEQRQVRADRVWVISVPPDPTAIGYCGLFHLDDVNGQTEIEIGYRLIRSGWGQGIATEAARAVRDYALRDLGLRRLIARIDPANTRSIRVAERLGMTLEAEVMLPGYTHPDHVYAFRA